MTYAAQTLTDYGPRAGLVRVSEGEWCGVEGEEMLDLGSRGMIGKCLPH